MAKKFKMNSIARNNSTTQGTHRAHLVDGNSTAHTHAHCQQQMPWRCLDQIDNLTTQEYPCVFHFFLSCDLHFHPFLGGRNPLQSEIECIFKPLNAQQFLPATKHSEFFDLNEKRGTTNGERQGKNDDEEDKVRLPPMKKRPRHCLVYS